MKRIFCLALMLLLVCSLSVAAFAQGGTYILDSVELLSKEERQDLEERAAEISQAYACGVFIALVDDYRYYGSSMEDACYEIYEGWGLGADTNGDGILLLLSMDGRDYYIQDFGAHGQYVMTDYGRESLEDAMLHDLGQNHWHDGLSGYLGQCEYLLLYTQNYGEPLGEDDNSVPLANRIFTAYGIALVIGLVVALITCSIFKAQMKTAVKATSAEAYVSPGGVDMHIREDRYTHTTRRERRIETNSGSRSGGGGGGRSSGGGGKF